MGVVHGRKDGKEKEEQMQEFEIEELREILIREIENRMPTHRGTCKQWYIVKLRDTPDIHCMWCRIGIYDCVELNEVKNVQGLKWLCNKCESIFAKHIFTKLDHAASFTGFDNNNEQNKGQEGTMNKSNK